MHNTANLRAKLHLLGLGLALAAQACDVQVEKQCPSKSIGEDTTWALWPMPNPTSTGLPNPSNYEIDADKSVVTDQVTCLMWQRDVAPDPLNWADAKDYCDTLDLAGFTDWRLPKRIELISLVDFTKPIPEPTIDTGAFPNTPSDWFWTSSPWVGGGPPSMWIVHFNNNGGSSVYDVTFAYTVRCVR